MGNGYVFPAALCRMLGRTEADLLATRFEEAIHPPDVEVDRARYQRLVRGEIESFDVETRLVAAGRHRFMGVHSFILFVRDGGTPSHLVVRILDITTRKLAEEQLRASQKMENVGMLAGGLAHDFNNLLTAIDGTVNLAQLELDPRSEAAVELTNVETIARRAAELTRRLLVLGAAGRSIKRRIDLNQIVTENAQVLAAFCRESRLDLDLGSDGMPLVGDSVQVQQVLMNLVINAAQAIGDTKGTIRVRTRREHLEEKDMRWHAGDPSMSPGPCVVLEVMDTGCGLTPDEVHKIFDAFYTTKPTGRGLGLAVTRAILREHRAGLRVESEPGRGTSFHIYFPICEPASARPAAPMKRILWPSVRGTALVVEDAVEVRRIVTPILKTLGFEVREATGAQEALLELAKHGGVISLVLLDLGTPRATEAAVRSMREHWPELHIVATTTAEEPAALESADPHLCLLPKPYGRLDLRRAIFGEGDQAAASGDS